MIAKQLGEGPVADTLDEHAQAHRRDRPRGRGGAARLPAWQLQRRMGLQRARRPPLHWALYAVVLIVPLLGWAGISISAPVRSRSASRCRRSRPEGAGYDEVLLRLHAYAAFALLALVAFHIGMAIQDTMTAGQPASLKRAGFRRRRVDRPTLPGALLRKQLPDVARA